MNTRYPTPMILIHWLVALLVLTAYITGGNPVRHGFEGEIHVASGMAIALLFLIRLPLRLLFQRKIPSHNLPAWQHYPALLVHLALYACMILLPLTGMLALSEKTEQYVVFGMQLPLFSGFSLGEWEELEDIGELHELLGQAFIALAGVHAAAALVHHFIFKDGVLKSMLIRK